MNTVKLSDKELRTLKKDTLETIESYERISKQENGEWALSGIELYNSILDKLESAKKED